MSTKLIVFDWDGTLMDSEAKIVACMHSAIKDLGMEARSNAELRHIIGLGLREALTQLYPEGTDSEYQLLVERYRHHFLHADDTASPLFEGSRELIESLSQTEHFLAIATGKGRQGLDKVLNETGLADCFHYTRCADETHSKPHPQMLLDIMDYLGIEKEHTLMIGDTVYDLQMASNAGVDSLAVSYGVHEQHLLQECGPLAIVNDIQQVAQWLTEQFLSKVA